jgi:hypothetical protein
MVAVDRNGQELAPSELRTLTALDYRTLSRGLKTARKMGLLTPDSHARYLRTEHLPWTWQEVASA